MSLNTKSIATLALFETKNKGSQDKIAVGGEDGVGKHCLIQVECLAYDRAKASFDCQTATNVAERVVIGLSFLDESRLAAVYNDFAALAFIVLG